MRVPGRACGAPGRAYGAPVQVVLLVLALAEAACAITAASAVSAQLREPTDTYVTAYINVTYKDAKGEVRSERSETAKFGDGRIGAARGVLVHAVSMAAPGGCAPPLIRASSATSRPGSNSTGGAAASNASTALPSEPWIALIRRGFCTFDMKVHNAALSGAVAVIVYDDKEADTLDMMDISPEHNITAVLTYRWKGEHLAKLANGNSKVYVEISVANRCTRTLNSINRTSVLFVSVSFIVLMIISLAWLVFYYVQRFRYIHAKDRLSRRLCSAAKRALSKIPTRRLKIDDPELVGDGDCCAICIERYRVADVVRALPCRHEFHKSCIDPWLLDHRTCPMCKMDILKHYGFVFTGSQESILHLDIEEVAAFGLGVDSPNSTRGHIQQQHHQQYREQQLPQPPQQQMQYHSPQQQAESQRSCMQLQQDCQQLCTGEDLQPQQSSCEREEPLGIQHEEQASFPQQRPVSPGALSSSSSESGSSCCSRDSGSSVTDSILPQVKRSHIVGSISSSAISEPQ